MGVGNLKVTNQGERVQGERTSSFSARAACVALAVLVLPVFLSRSVRASAVTHVVFTIDVCWVCGTDFRGAYQGVDYGVPFIVERLNRHGMKGTFFVNPFCPDNLQRTMKENMEFLIDSGHDIQFHPHPELMDPSREDLTDYPRSEKTTLYQQGISELIRLGVPHPVAFRAGNYAVDPETLEILPSLGIHIDSSIFPNDRRSLVPLPLDDANRFTKIGGIYQLPITLIRFLPLPGYWATTALDIDRTIWCEQETALDQLASHKVPTANVFLHFHTFYTYENPIEACDPRQVTGVKWENIAEMDAMLNMLSHDKRFKVVTVRELWEIFLKDPQALQGPAFIPYTGIVMTYKRAWAHFWGHGINNKILALAPIFAAAMLIPAIVRRRGARR